MENKKNDFSNHCIMIGGKPFMNYVTAVVVQFSDSDVKEIVIKSRGKFISKAVDVCEVVRNKFLVDSNIKIFDVKIGSEDFVNKEGKKVSVSTMEIVLNRD